MKTPERIWRDVVHNLDEKSVSIFYTENKTSGIEYIRADVVERMLSEQREACGKKSKEYIYNHGLFLIANAVEKICSEVRIEE